MVATKRSTALLLLLLFVWSPIGCSVIRSSPAKHEKTPPATTVPPTTGQTQATLHPTQEVHPVTPPETKYLTHKIKWRGENLGQIADWYTGFAKNWKRLVEANPGINPRRIAIGDSILIPEDLVINHSPMPASFLHPEPPETAETGKEKDSSLSSPKQMTKADINEFFEPVDTPQKTEGDGVPENDAPLPLETIE